MNNADELKNSGLKATLPRIKILEVFQRSRQRHMTAEDVFKALLAEGADVGLATVYRVLMQFEQAGLLTRSNFESGKSVFELNEGQHHDHLVCLTCGRVEEFFDPQIEQRDEKIALERGFELHEHSLALYTACTKTNCQPRQVDAGPDRAWRFIGWLACNLWLAVAASWAAPAFEDTMAQRLLACHRLPRQGRARGRRWLCPRASPASRQGCLFRQLRAFRDGQRRYALMGNLLAPLDDAYLREIASHFATLELPYAAPPPSRADAATLRHGQVLAQQGDAARRAPACQACHGTALTGLGADVPGLLGLPVDYLNAQLGAWRTGTRHADAPDCMAQIAQRLSPQDVNALAHWLAAQPVPAQPAPKRAGPSADALRQHGAAHDEDGPWPALVRTGRSCWPSPCGG